MNVKTTLSIVTVVRNDVVGFLETYQSLALQKDAPAEWLIIDGSESNEIQHALQHENRINFKYHRLPPHGIYEAMNQGLMRAKSEFVWFLNAGDALCTPETISIVTTKLNQFKEVDIFGFAVVYKTSSNYLYGVVNPQILVKPREIVSAIHHQGAVIRREKVLLHGGFDEKLKYAADGKLLDNLVNLEKSKLFDVAVVFFRMGGVSGKYYRAINKEMMSFRTSAHEHVNFIKHLKNTIRNFIERDHQLFLLRISLGVYLRKREKNVKRKVLFQ